MKPHSESAEHAEAAQQPITGNGDAQDTQPIEVSEEAAEIVKQLQAELDEAVEARKRALADFRNYQRRALESEQRALESGAARVVRALMPVIDNFDLMLKQKSHQMTVEQLMSAVQIVRDELNKTLQNQGVVRIEPARGEPFDPHKHEAVMRQPADDLPPNSIVATMQPGFALRDQVLRPAKVSISPSAEE